MLMIMYNKENKYTNYNQEGEAYSLRRANILT